LHLDIKPANVLVTVDGGVKIVDFGIARAASDATATVAGTPHYMAPEQFEGRADERSDIYSVGCLLYECLTGVPPFQGTMASQLLAHRSHPRPDPRDITPEVNAPLAAVVKRAMAIDPADRYQTVQEMHTALAGIDLPAAPPAPLIRPLERSAPEIMAVRADSSAVTRWGKLQTFAIGLTLSAFIVALVPGLVWLTNAFVPYEYRPAAMGDDRAGAWWMLAVTIAGVVLLLRRRGFFALLSGPAVGDEQLRRRDDPAMRAGLQMAAGAALRGSIPMLFPSYVAMIAAIASGSGISWPDDVFSSWGVCWLLMPLAAVVLGLRSLKKLRPRLGAVLTSIVYAAGAVLAVILFVAYPFAA
jgi:hypothetical protein